MSDNRPSNYCNRCDMDGQIMENTDPDTDERIREICPTCNGTKQK